MNQPSDEIRAAAARLYADRCIPVARIAEQLSITQSQIYRWVKSEGWPMRTQTSATTTTGTGPLPGKREADAPECATQAPTEAVAPTAPATGAIDTENLRQRLVAVIDWTISQLEQQMNDGLMLHATERERNSRTISTLTRSIDKIEENKIGRRKVDGENDGDSDTSADAQRLRHALAERIIKLRDELLNHGCAPQPPADEPASDRKIVE